MRKYNINIFFVMFITMMTTSLAFAQEHVIKITIVCPDIGMCGQTVVTNYGSYVAGLGIEKVDNDASTFPLFQNPLVFGLNIPFNLMSHGYYNDGVIYNPSQGVVICKYSSSKGFDGFYLSSSMKNASHGYVIASSVEEIHIRIPVGSL